MGTLLVVEPEVGRQARFQLWHSFIVLDDILRRGVNRHSPLSGDSGLRVSKWARRSYTDQKSYVRCSRSRAAQTVLIFSGSRQRNEGGRAKGISIARRRIGKLGNFRPGSPGVAEGRGVASSRSKAGFRTHHTDPALTLAVSGKTRVPKIFGTARRFLDHAMTAITAARKFRILSTYLTLRASEGSEALPSLARQG